MKPAERIPSEPTPIGKRPSRTRKIVAGAIALAVLAGALVAWRVTRAPPQWALHT